MNRKLYLVLDAFLVGMLFEYLLRVEVSFFPVTMIILLTGSIILDFVLDYYKNKKKGLVKEIQHNMKQIIINENKLDRVPNGWMVYDAGQDPLHMLWYLTLVNFDDLVDDTIMDKRQVSVEERGSYLEALTDAISKIKIADLKKV
jgi:hypothetical protein